MTTNPSKPDPADAPEAWLAQEPPPRVTRLVGWVILGLFAAGALAAFTLSLPETVRCRFVLVSDSGADPLQAPLDGTLARVLTVEGQEVGDGVVLFEIRSREILDWQTQLAAALEDQRATRERARRNQETYRSLIESREASIRQFEEERDFRQENRTMAEDLVRRSSDMKAERLISEVEFLRAQLDLAAANKDLSIVNQGLIKARIELDQAKAERQLQQSEEEATLGKLLGTITSLQARLRECEGEVIRVRAPYPGVVLSISQRSAGSVVHAGQELAQISRSGGHPLAQLSLPQAGMDQVLPGQIARLYFDAFPYQRYGSLDSLVEWVSPSAVASGGESGFRARSTLGRDYFTTEGSSFSHVRVGMSGEARIRIGERTLAEYAFEPLKALREQSR